MGLFVHFRGTFECVRCRRVSDALIQTKLLRHERDNFADEYLAGDSELIVGLDDYCPLHPWDGSSPLVVVVGDWDCHYCMLNWQWAKATFKVEQAEGQRMATILELVGFQPTSPEQLAGVHFVQYELAELADYGVHLSVPERCAALAEGFRSWCREVAGVEPPA